MSEKTRVYDGSAAELGRLEQYVAAGITMLCPKCHAPLLLVLDLDSAKLHRRLQGVYCTRDADHFYQIFIPKTKTPSPPKTQ